MTVTLVASLLAWLGLTPHAASATRTGCFPRGSVTLAHSATARVFQVSRKDGSMIGTWGCLFASGRPKRLDHFTDTGTQITVFKPFRLAGSRLAVARRVSEFDGPNTREWTEVAVADLRPGHRLLAHAYRAASYEKWRTYYSTPDSQEYAEAEAFVSDLVLTRSGSVAWIACPGFTDGPCDSETTPGDSDPKWTSVFAVRAGQREQARLDEGPAIGRRSLHIAGGRLRWVNDNRPRSALFR